MALKDLLVHVDNSRACKDRLKVAFELAKAHESHVAGIYVIPSYRIPTYAEVEIGPELMEMQRQAGVKATQDAEALFRKVADGADVAAEWRAVEGNISEQVMLHARYVDLLVIGQADSDDPKSAWEGLVERLVVGVGRPVLMVPYIPVKKRVPQRVLVAWNATREAVRAVNDALPLLARAKHVEVLAVNPRTATEAHGDIPCADICLHLARHGVNASAHETRAEDLEVGDVLLSRAADEDVDLIVMGAYGHSRLRELVLGGATRHLLKHMTVPVLMAH